MPKELQDKLAAAIHDAMFWAAKQRGTPQRWQAGNSDVENYARSVARQCFDLVVAAAAIENERLKPCRECGHACRVEEFPKVIGHDAEAVKVWLCGAHHMFGGPCPSNVAYLTAKAWNERDD